MTGSVDSESGPDAIGDDETEIIEGGALTISFSGSKCIHSRFCVLQAPRVFKANTEGAWIDPDAMEAHDDRRSGAKLPIRRNPVPRQGAHA